MPGLIAILAVKGIFMGKAILTVVVVIIRLSPHRHG
jgi:hypothetical protein